MANAGQLHVGFIPYYELSAEQGAGRAPTGFLPDVFALFCQSAGIAFDKVRWRSMSWDSFASHVKTHAIELSISGTFITPERAKAVAFTHPLFALGNGAAARADDARFAGVTDVMQLDREGITIAVVTGEQSSEFVRAKFTKAKILPLDGPDLAAAPRAVEDGRADIAMSDQFILSRYIRERPALKDLLLGKPFSVLPIAWAVDKANGALLAEINPILDAIIGGPEFAALKRKYAVVPFAPLS
ncbi:transporter substrate-binding domain-containing protein [Sphingomonas sp. HITSZ_GF]|uniref:substrate-binding periplasmic protein n=1 Tax=Sphingomonas sp. HITSZ_GF TaxID=3037247 RepID=UPI00240DD6D9|nr:transporter substrate-binding domain-containing protein [Sphingomonas sp. HITSZ_GF]MDG2535517.1 transporter substrate-binding domain-containing protein [Sphingomonas sp. HITSZ_GF]